MPRILYHLRVILALSKVLDLALAPLTWALLLVLGALAFRRRPRLAAGLAAGAAAVLLVFSLEPVGDALARLAESSAPVTFRPDVTYDAVIVLGGVVAPAPSRLRGEAELDAAADRIVRAFELLRAGRARQVLLSAGLLHPQPREPSEAERLGEKLQDWGISPDRIVLETRSRNTHENAVESARVVAAHGWHALLLVTSAAHMPRALGCFRKAGLSPDALPVDFRGGDGRDPSWLPRAQALAQSTDALREMAGRLVYRLLGWSSP